MKFGVKVNSVSLTLALLFSASTAHADLVSAGGLAVERLLSDSENFGGCMVKFVNYDGPVGCKDKWVTFDCDGVHGTKEIGRRHFEMAQMAYALEKTVFIAVENSQTVNGYCAVKRIDIE